MMLGSSSRFIAAFAEPGPAELMMLCRSSRFIAAFAEPGPADAHDAAQVFWFDCLLVRLLPSRSLAELMLIMLGSSSRFIAAFAEPGPADAHDAVQACVTFAAFWCTVKHEVVLHPRPSRLFEQNGLSLAPRMCHMAAGGPRRFNVGEQEFARAISPYEVEFTIMHEARGGRHIMPGLFGEQSSLGFACHVTDPSRLAKDHFACVASDMMLVESGTAARVNNATVLMPEEMVFALTTICPSGMELALGFSQGPGGSADGREPQDIA
eukprot:s4216_g6.t1